MCHLDECDVPSVLNSKSSWALLHPPNCFAICSPKKDVLGSFGWHETPAVHVGHMIRI